MGPDNIEGEENKSDQRELPYLPRKRLLPIPPDILQEIRQPSRESSYDLHSLTVDQFVGELDDFTPDDQGRLKDLDAEIHAVPHPELREEYVGLLRRQEESYVKEALPILVDRMRASVEKSKEIPRFIATDEQAAEEGVAASKLYGPDDGTLEKFPAFDQAVKDGRLETIALGLMARQTQLSVEYRNLSKRLKELNFGTETDINSRGELEGKLNQTRQEADALAEVNQFLSDRLGLPDHWVSTVKWSDVLPASPVAV